MSFWELVYCTSIQTPRRYTFIPRDRGARRTRENASSTEDSGSRDPRLRLLSPRLEACRRRQVPFGISGPGGTVVWSVWFSFGTPVSSTRRSWIWSTFPDLNVAFSLMGPETPRLFLTVRLPDRRRVYCPTEYPS